MAGRTLGLHRWPDGHQLVSPVQQRLAAQPGGNLEGFPDRRYGIVRTQLLGMVEQVMS
jgi:hypothetical protein